MLQPTPTNHITSPPPKYRKTLNPEQIRVLSLLQGYRFISAEQLARFFGKPSGKAVQKRLKILEDQGYITKRYDSSYKLRGKPAAYCLLPKGARRLLDPAAPSADAATWLKRIYKDKSVSEAFITHCLSVTSIALELLGSYGDKLGVFPKSDLSSYDLFPEPRPDAFLRLQSAGTEQLFFLDNFEAGVPFFVILRRVRAYLQYAEEGEWEATGTVLPTILIVCATATTNMRLRKRLARALVEAEDEVVFATTTIGALTSHDHDGGKVWQGVDLDGDDEDDPISPQALSGLSPAGPD